MGKMVHVVLCVFIITISSIALSPELYVIHNKLYPYLVYTGIEFQVEVPDIIPTFNLKTFKQIVLALSVI